MKEKEPDPSDYLRLTPEFIARFDWKGSQITREGFRNWARNRRDIPIHISMHKWAPLHQGRPVPRPIVEAFSEYISTNLGMGRHLVSEIAVPSAPGPAEKDQPGGREKNAWRLDFTRLFGDIARNFSPPEEAYCLHEGDVRDAAIMVMHYFGATEGKATSKATALAFAEREMKRTPDEYARMLLLIWQANENAVLFTTLRDKEGGSERVGVSVVAPLTEAFYRRFRGGEAEDFDVTAADTASKSLFQFVDAICDNPEIDVRREKARRSMIQARTVLYQFAALCPPLQKGVSSPRMITHAGAAESMKRLRSYNYREVGTTTRVTGKPVMEFSPPDLASLGIEYPRYLAQYLAMKSTLLVYQASIEAQQRLITD